MTRDQWLTRVATNPFPTYPPKALHGFFTHGTTLDITPMQPYLAPSERISSQPGVLWLHAPDGIGRSKLAARLERLTGHPITARSGNTLAAITALLTP